MNEKNLLAEQFETHRAHLRRVAYRMLGSLDDADDAVQESWLRLSRSDAATVENVGGWLTTVVARLCLETLRVRRSHREEPLIEESEREGGINPENEALLADSIGIALLVVLETLTPAERLAFVLHDMFDLPFEEIAPMVERSPAAARQLASRARRRVKGSPTPLNADLARHREIVGAFLAASREGNFNALLEVLDPDVIRRADLAAVGAAAPTEVRGAVAVATGAVAFSRRARFAQLALVDGDVGIVVAPLARLILVLAFKIVGRKITEIDVIADPGRLSCLKLAILND